jgi:hypothetical protein
MSVVTEPFDGASCGTLLLGRGTEPATPGLIEFARQAPAQGIASSLRSSQ